MAIPWKADAPFCRPLPRMPSDTGPGMDMEMNAQLKGYTSHLLGRRGVCAGFPTVHSALSRCTDPTGGWDKHSQVLVVTPHFLTFEPMSLK